MKIYRYIETFILALAVFSISSCHKGDLISSGADDEVMVLFTPQFNGYIGTRAIGDASGIDRLKFAVYEIKGKSKKTKNRSNRKFRICWRTTNYLIS